MIQRGAHADLRCLVVDDDEGVREFLLAILAREGIRAQSCADGREAAQLMRTSRWDLLLIDLGVPVVHAGELLRLIHGGALPRPRWTALMGATRPLANVDGKPWMTGVTFLPKPFVAADVRALLDQAIGRRDPLAMREIVITGGGLWADALARVISRRGGCAVIARNATELRERLRETRPSAVVLGPPLDGAELVRAIVLARDEVGGTPVLAALRPGSATAGDVLAIGALGAFMMPADLPTLGGEVLRAAGLRRVHRRAPLLAPVLCRTGRVLHAAIASDLGEGGLGLEAVSREHGHGIAEVEFTLPGGAAIIAAAAPAWVDASDSRARMGLRFTDVDDEAVDGIRRHVTNWQRAVTGDPAPQ